MKHELIEHTWGYQVRLTNAAKSSDDLVGKTIEKIVIGLETVIRFTDGSCAIVEVDYEEFRDSFGTSDLNWYGFLLDQEDIDNIKALRDAKNKEVDKTSKQQRLACLQAEIKALTNELSNS